VFFSAHARDEAVAEDVVEPQRASVVHIGVDHSFPDAHGEPVAPPGAADLPDDLEAILCIGTDFRHKNRLFAIRLVERLRSHHGWKGCLLLAGPHVNTGSSSSDEAEQLALNPTLAASVLDFGAVSESEKAWLYSRARLTVYPTVHEGFGLVPFESADHGVPCMWAHGTSLTEILPESAASIVPWSVEESAGRAFELLRDDRARERNLSSIRAAAAPLTWDATAARLIDVYRAACAAPPTSFSALERREVLMTGVLSEDALRLIGPYGVLPHDLERPLLALATHPTLAAPMFGAIKFGYRASFRFRQRVRRRSR
jgi:glycosyltransferase involved in cell wall biosynthesis